MTDFHLRDAIEAEFRGPPQLRPELAEFEVVADETRIAMLIVRAEDIQAGLPTVAWHAEEKIGVLTSLPLEPSLSGFVWRTLHARLRSAKIKRVFIPRVRQVDVATPTELRFSRRTLDLVRRGFVLRASSMEDLLDNKPEEFEASDEQISSFVREQLIRTFGGVADFLTQYSKPKFTIAYEGNFIGSVDLLLQSRIPNVPKEFSLLSNSICSDIVRHLRDGGRVEAAWGGLKMNGSAVVLVATGTPVSPPEPAGRAKLIE